MSRRDRRQVMIILLIMAISAFRLVIQTDPLEEFAQTITKPLFSLFEDSAKVSNQADVILQSQSEQALQSLRQEKNLNPDKFTTLSADVVRRDVRGFRRSVWLNKGSTAGLKINQAVSSNGFLVGKVSQVGSDWSEVVLISDPMFRATISVNGDSGVLINRAGSTIADLFAAKNLSSKIVQTDGLDSELPPGLLIGRIGVDISKDNNIFHTYSLELGVNPSTIELVEVILLP